jgi:hypothetical protein
MGSPKVDERRGGEPLAVMATVLTHLSRWAGRETPHRTGFTPVASASALGAQRDAKRRPAETQASEACAAASPPRRSWSVQKVSVGP